MDNINRVNFSMTEERANKIYDLLVTIGGASESDRDDFVYYHTETKTGQWRFCGYLGFGGKYLSNDNRVSYYKEDGTPEIIEIANKLNEELKKYDYFIFIKKYI